MNSKITMKHILFLFIILESCSCYCQNLKIEISDSIVLYHYATENYPGISICIKNSSKQGLLFYHLSDTLFAINKKQEKDRSFTGMAFVLKDSINNYYYSYTSPSIFPHRKISKKNSFCFNENFNRYDTTILVENESCFKTRINFPDLGLSKGTYDFYILYNIRENDIPFASGKSIVNLKLEFVGFLKSNIIQVKIY